MSKADDSMSVIVGWYDDGHLTAKSNLGTALWILQADLEMLLHFGNVVVDDVDRDLQLTVAWCKVQLPRTGREKKTKRHAKFKSVS